MRPAKTATKTPPRASALVLMVPKWQTMNPAAVPRLLAKSWIPRLKAGSWKASERAWRDGRQRPQEPRAERRLDELDAVIERIGRPGALGADLQVEGPGLLESLLQRVRERDERRAGAPEELDGDGRFLPSSRELSELTRTFSSAASRVSPASTPKAPKSRAAFDDPCAASSMLDGQELRALSDRAQIDIRRLRDWGKQRKLLDRDPAALGERQEIIAGIDGRMSQPHQRRDREAEPAERQAELEPRRAQEPRSGC